MSVAQSTQSGAQNSPERRRPGSQTPLLRVRAVVPAWRTDELLAARLVNYLWPWTAHNYPGLRGGMLSVLARPVTWGAVQHWFHGRRPLPGWAARAIEDRIRREVLVGEQLLSELAAYRAEQVARLRHQPGKLSGRGLDE